MKGPQVVGIVTARLDSTRLPNKALTPVRGLPLVGYVIARGKRIRNLKALVLATSERSVDDPLVSYALSQDIPVYRGSLSDVALRLLNCAMEFGADYCVRLNGDSPFLDYDLISDGITYCQDDRIDMVSNLIGRSFPYGISLEIIRIAALERAHALMASPEDHEHVTRYFYRHPQQFNIQSIISDRPDLSRARMVVDTEADLRMFEFVVGQLGDTVFDVGYRQVAPLYLGRDSTAQLAH